MESNPGPDPAEQQKAPPYTMVQYGQADHDGKQATALQYTQAGFTIDNWPKLSGVERKYILRDTNNHEFFINDDQIINVTKSNATQTVQAEDIDDASGPAPLTIGEAWSLPSGETTAPINEVLIYIGQSTASTQWKQELVNPFAEIEQSLEAIRNQPRTPHKGQRKPSPPKEIDQSYGYSVHNTKTGYSIYPPPHIPAYEADRQSPSRTPMLGQFNSLADARHYPRIKDEGEFDEGLGRLRDHLNDIAGDPSGSDPAQYVSKRDLDFFSWLQRAASDEMSTPWKGATPITHEETTPRWLPGSRRADGIVKDSKGEQVVGYRVGYLNVSQFEAPVFFCSDGTLRMSIKHNYRRTTKTGPVIRTGDKRRTFSGYCRLPDPELLYPVRTRGTQTGVSFSHGQTNTVITEIEALSGYSFS